jgi:hypothetical protein
MSGKQLGNFLLPCVLGLAVLWPSLGPARATDAPGEASRLDPLLDRTAAAVEKSLAQFSEVTCKESVVQSKFGKNGKVELKENSLFDYLVLFQSSTGEPIMVESRLPKDEHRKPQNLPLLLTNGFSSLLLIFHPYYAGDFQFTDLGEDAQGGQICEKVSFQHVKGLRSTTALLLSGREYPLDLRGTAWVDKATGMIVKIDAALESPMEDLGLRSIEANVQYTPVKFQDVPQAYWLPASAVIDVESVHQHWRNLHQFTGYRHFETSQKETIGSAR